MLTTSILSIFGECTGKRPLDADAEGMLAHGEGLAGAFALALDDDALEYLDAATGTLDDLEVYLDGIPGLELGYSLAELLLLDPGYGLDS